MLGRDVVKNYRIVQNDCFNRDLYIDLGKTKRGTEVRILQEFIECDFKILTGFIEPHFFVGFSGGGKAITPGLASPDTIMQNHSVQNIDSENATWGVTETNPVWEDIQEASSKAKPDFLLNVALNHEKRISGIFAGNPQEAYLEGIEFVKQSSMVPVKKAYNIVITSNSGYPLDLNLYQSVKGMSAASRIVREGGAIVMVAECSDGIPDHGEYGKLLFEEKNPQKLLEKIHKPGFHVQDMWQAQIHAKICLKADVYFYTENLTEEQMKKAFLKPVKNLDNTLKTLIEKYRPDVSICVLPDGPLNIPYIK